MSAESADAQPVEVCLGALSLRPDAIDPRHVLDGTPVTRSAQWATGSDGIDTHHMWDCTAGRFRWFFGCDETVVVVEGEVEVFPDDAASFWLRAGDSARFRAGTWATWHVPNYVRKHAVLHRELPWPLGPQLRAGRRLRAALRRRRATPATDGAAGFSLVR